MYHIPSTLTPMYVEWHILTARLHNGKGAWEPGWQHRLLSQCWKVSQRKMFLVLRKNPGYWGKDGRKSEGVMVQKKVAAAFKVNETVVHTTHNGVSPFLATILRPLHIFHILSHHKGSINANMSNCIGVMFTFLLLFSGPTIEVLIHTSHGV